MPSAHRNLAGSRALVTGASGFIGGHLCRRLTEAGVVVHAVSRTERQPDASVARWWLGDLAEPRVAASLLDEVQPETVFHLASHVFGSRELSVVAPTFRDNLVSTVNLLTAVAEQGECSVILSGSMDEPRPGEEATPSSPYAAAKIAASTYARLFHALYDLPVVITRIFMVYGPDQKDEKKLVPYVARSLLSGEAPELSSGARSVDWVYVEDVADALATFAALDNIGGQTLDVGTGAATSVRKVVEELADIVGGGIEPTFGAVDERPMETEPVADIGTTLEATGWHAKIDLREGLERTVAWHRQRLAASD